METLNDENLLLIVQVGILLVCFGVEVEPFVEFILTLEQCGHQEIQETPKFAHVVHQRGACE